MATLDEPLEPEEVLAAAEAAHLAARDTVPIPAPAARPGGPEVPLHRRDTVPLPRERRAGLGAEPGDGRATVRLPRGRPPGGGPPPGPPRRRAPLPLAAAVAAGWAALAGLGPAVLLVVLLHAGEVGSWAPGGAARVAAAGWLLAHGVPVATATGPIGIAPLALSALAAWRLHRAGVHVTRAMGARGAGSAGIATLGALTVAVGYGVVGALVAGLAGGDWWSAAVPRAGATVAGFGFLAAWSGSLASTGALARLVRRTPVVIADGVRTGLVAAALVLAGGAGTAGLAISLDGGAATDTVAAYRTGIAGQAGLTLLCLAFLPNLAVWAAAYLLGPGFVVGAGTVVRTSEVAVGPLPALPVFAGLPGGPLPTAGVALFAVPLLAGALAGWLLARRRLRAPAGPAPAGPGPVGPGPVGPGSAGPGPVGPGPPGAGPAGRGGRLRLIGAAVLAGPVAGAALGLLAQASGGPVGGGHLATTGPVGSLAGQVAAVSSVVIGVGAPLAVAVAAVFLRAARPRRSG